MAVSSLPIASSLTDEDQIIRDFVTRGLIVLPPEELGIGSDVHDRIYTKEREIFRAGERATTSRIPEVLGITNAPGLVAVCNLILGENWAIVPYTHNTGFVRVREINTGIKTTTAPITDENSATIKPFRPNSCTTRKRSRRTWDPRR
ncbi:MAG: hypothetical protein CM1200mP9_09480 [Gammaproteobacteria bacterium]|nr:MAG: hypothetical protein CM1200mP9_09480 [Gammaproteobacteria bacterium]